MWTIVAFGAKRDKITIFLAKTFTMKIFEAIQKHTTLQSLLCIKCRFYLYATLVLIVIPVACERRQFDIGPDIPAHLPAPPGPDPPPKPSSPSDGLGSNSEEFDPNGQFGFFANNPPIPPPQNVPVGPGPVGPGPLGAGRLPDDFVPFGLNHVILIIVPQFKTKFRKLPSWLESSVKVAMPITVFFDKLQLGPSFPPGLLPPGVLPPGAGAGVSAGISAQAGVAPGAPAGPLNPNQPIVPGYPGQYSYGGLYPYVSQDDDDDEDEDGEDEDSDVDDDGSYDGYYAEDRKSRRKRRHLLAEMDNTLRKNRHKRSIPFNKTVHAAERATLLPKLENILDSTGLGGKACLLRAVCEVHEAPLHHYGLLGEIFTMFFSVSRSVFAQSHLPEYLRAERIGKSGDCSEFYKDCEKTMFSWEESIPHYSDLENVISL